jgi:hypothetical protein
MESNTILQSAATAVFEGVHALSHLKELQECSAIVANPPNPLSSYEANIIKQEESVSWKLWLGSFVTYAGSHRMLSKTALFRNRLFVPQFIAIVPALALVIGGGALFRQRTLEKLVNPPPAAVADSQLAKLLKDKYPFL